jgi:hypothetical protein
MQGAIMFDDISGWHAGVDKEGILGTRIAVPAQRVAEVCRILAAHRIPHAIERRVFTAQDEFSPQPTARQGAD